MELFSARKPPVRELTLDLNNQRMHPIKAYSQNSVPSASSYDSSPTLTPYSSTVWTPSYFDFNNLTPPRSAYQPPVTYMRMPMNSPAIRASLSPESVNAPEFIPRSQSLLAVQSSSTPMSQDQPVSNCAIYGSGNQFNYPDPVNTSVISPGSAMEELSGRDLNELEAKYSQFKVKPDFGALFGQGRKAGRPSRSRVRPLDCYDCAFCKNNGEKADVYRSHVLKDPLGNIICPVLRYYNCPICNNGGGNKAHTIRYCPKNKPRWRKELIDEAMAESHNQ